ncbi:MAG: hypothetical protein KJO99_05100 [Nitrosopumilus sp.]|nr:hypothetical protein [Nitrosopumilus sp.]NNL53367.1 hypothetical protein [Nitrosopumilus sp.]
MLMLTHNFTTISSPVGFENIKATNIFKNNVMNTAIPVNPTIKYGIIDTFSN